MPAGNISSNWDNKAFNAEDSLSDKARLPYRPLSVWLRSILKILIFNWWKLLYNFVLISAIQQHECHNFIYIYIHTHPFPPFPPYPHSTLLGHHKYQAGLPMLHISAPLVIYFIHDMVCMSTLLLSSSHPHLFPYCVHKSVLYHFPQYWFSRFHIYALVYYTCFFLLDSLHSV